MEEKTESWEERWRELRSTVIVTKDSTPYNTIVDVAALEKRDIDFISSLLEQEREEQKVKGERNRLKIQIRADTLAEVLEIMESELCLAHTTESGKTSRLTSAYNRICKLQDIINLIKTNERNN